MKCQSELVEDGFKKVNLFSNSTSFDKLSLTLLISMFFLCGCELNTFNEHQLRLSAAIFLFVPHKKDFRFYPPALQPVNIYLALIMH
jgi:hypothetical protein